MLSHNILWTSTTSTFYPPTTRNCNKSPRTSISCCYNNPESCTGLWSYYKVITTKTVDTRVNKPQVRVKGLPPPKPNTIYRWPLLKSNKVIKMCQSLMERRISLLMDRKIRHLVAVDSQWKLFCWVILESDLSILVVYFFYLIAFTWTLMNYTH